MNAIATIKNGIQARAYAGEIEGGADVLEYVGGGVVVSILIAALFVFGNMMGNTINVTGSNISTWFNTTVNTATGTAGKVPA